jgi:hypothetical protein
MIKRIGFAFIIFLGIIVLLINIFPYYDLIDFTDQLIAYSLPRYPNSTYWQISGTSGIPDGAPEANIKFETSDDSEKIINFYTKELTKNGWKAVQNEYLKYDLHDENLPLGTLASEFFRKRRGTTFYTTIWIEYRLGPDNQRVTTKTSISVTRYKT